MSKCNDNIKFTCGKEVPARCVSYEGNISDNSNLEVDGCLTAHDTIQDLYTLLEEFEQKIDTSNLGSDCINYAENPPSLSDVLKEYEQRLCSIANQSVGGGISFDLSQVDVGCLEGLCDPNISTLEQLLNALIAKVCALEVQVTQNYPQFISNAQAIAAGLSVGDIYWVAIGSIEAVPGTLRRVI